MNLTKTHLELTAYRKIRSMLYVLVCIVFFFRNTMTLCNGLLGLFVSCLIVTLSVLLITFVYIYLTCVCVHVLFLRVFSGHVQCKRL